LLTLCDNNNDDNDNNEENNDKDNLFRFTNNASLALSHLCQCLGGPMNVAVAAVVVAAAAANANS
jgi:hypothetical protein